MLTVFVYAKLWRRSNVMSDIEFYEIRYSGKAAAFLRGFRALYLGVFFNVMIMAMVSLAAIKIGSVMLGLKPLETILLASVVTVIFSAMGGLKAVLITDFLLFIAAMVGAIAAAVVALNQPEVGGLSGLISHENVVGKLSILPSFDMSNKDSINLLATIFILPLIIQWWSVWYPGAEPGGGGYIAQRMLAAKNEKNAIGATLFFNITHYAIRPWPWIIVALCSLIVFPDLESLQVAFPNVAPSLIDHDLGYPAMLTFLPHGWLGLVVASLIAAFMSTISTHLNWGSSYVVNDFWKRFINPDASEKELVRVGRISIVLMMIFSALLALGLQNAIGAFQILLQVGAGTGLLFILRWFWWRINAFSEIAAMIVSFAAACYFEIIHTRLGFAELEYWQQLLFGVGITTISWVVVTLLTRPTDKETLRSFYKLVYPGGRGWKKVIDEAKADNLDINGDKAWDLPYSLLCMLFGCTCVYGTLFATGYWIYGNTMLGVIFTTVAVLSAILLIKTWKKLKIS